MATSAIGNIETFVIEATKAGSTVFQTKLGEVNNYISDVARKHNMKNIVISKSVLADRIGLTKVLQDKGLNVKNTGIKEWLAQKNSNKSNKEPENNIEEARLELRGLYVSADIGISEAVIGVAETGTLILASNEGNDRLASLLPALHMTIIEKRNIVATWEEAIMKLRELYKDKNGWQLPSYITYLTGRNTTGDIPGALRARAQGPEEEHVIVVEVS
jgi:L-lactate dehydrogenase complex protein LldF